MTAFKSQVTKPSNVIVHKRSSHTIAHFSCNTVHLKAFYWSHIHLYLLLCSTLIRNIPNSKYQMHTHTHTHNRRALTQSTQRHHIHISILKWKNLTPTAPYNPLASFLCTKSNPGALKLYFTAILTSWATQKFKTPQTYTFLVAKHYNKFFTLQTCKKTASLTTNNYTCTWLLSTMFTSNVTYNVMNRYCHG